MSGTILYVTIDCKYIYVLLVSCCVHPYNHLTGQESCLRLCTMHAWCIKQHVHTPIPIQRPHTASSTLYLFKNTIHTCVHTSRVKAVCSQVQAHAHGIQLYLLVRAPMRIQHTNTPSAPSSFMKEVKGTNKAVVLGTYEASLTHNPYRSPFRCPRSLSVRSPGVLFPPGKQQAFPFALKPAASPGDLLSSQKTRSLLPIHVASRPWRD